MLPGVGESHCEVEHHQHEQSFHYEVESSDSVFYIDYDSGQYHFESSEGEDFTECCDDSFCHILVICIYSSPVEGYPSACDDKYEINSGSYERVYDFCYISQTKYIFEHVVEEFAVALEFSDDGTDDIIDPPPRSDIVSLEKSPVMMSAIRIEKYISRWADIILFEPCWSASVDEVTTDILEIISSEVIIPLDEYRIFYQNFHTILW